MLVNVFLIIGIGNEEKRKERSQVAYERKKLVNKLKAKVEKIVDKKLGSQFEVGVLHYESKGDASTKTEFITFISQFTPSFKQKGY
ncbi:Ribosomal protein L13 family protein [Trifolium repens]|nr:Ribosomal protein L13 family protein [Trifolium repens]